MKKRRTTTKDVGLLAQLHEDGQLVLAPEFQRNSVWPRAAKAYLIDTILHDLPIPALLFRRSSGSSSNRPQYEVVDGQQRLRAVFAFLSGGVALDDEKHRRWKDLSEGEREQIKNYDFVVEELTGYGDTEIHDIFKRTNRYTVRLSPQELRNAQEKGEFAAVAQSVGAWPFWKEHRVFTSRQFDRMVNTEFAAELLILLAEGPQDKKASVDTWYLQYREEFPMRSELSGRLRSYLDWLDQAVPELATLRFRRATHLYGLVGAMDQLTMQAADMSVLDAEGAKRNLKAFEKELAKVASVIKDPLSSSPRPRLDREAQRYYLAASRQTDNLNPRETRIAVMASLVGLAD